MLSTELRVVAHGTCTSEVIPMFFSHEVMVEQIFIGIEGMFFIDADVAFVVGSAWVSQK